ncbi:MAG TPA: hypothetical protein VNO31_02770 [Umezawaea sp.]|nr:hypothetical protein [Umezawaea sp.]
MRLPDPEQADCLDDLVARLRLLKAAAHDRSYSAITRIVNDRRRRAGRPGSELTTKSTVAGYFTFGRRRLDEELLVAIVSALHADPEYVERWRGALRAVRGDATAADLVNAWSRLPTPPAAFIGRHNELRRLDELAAIGGTAVIYGMAGVGKTWLAVHAAHRLLRANSSRSVCLAADLRGHVPDAPPASPSAVLGVFLRHLGVRSDRIPRDLAGRIEAYRALTHKVSVLVYLDDAADDDNVTPLLPDGPGCLTLVTSRRELSNLESTVGLQLSGLDPADSLELLRGVAGTARVDVDHAVARQITRELGQHPLGLSIVGRHLRDHPDWAVGDCARPVALALSGGARTAVALSDRRLPDATRRLLRLLSLHPGRDIGHPAVAALSDSTVDSARAHLRTLVYAQLIEQPRPGRYVLHELIRGYAAEMVGYQEPAGEVRAAAARLFDYYRRTAVAAVSLLSPDDGHGGRSPGEGADRRGPGTIEWARRWMADEYPNLLLITAHAAIHGWPELAHFMATTLARYQPVHPHGRAPSESVRGRPPPSRRYATVLRQASRHRDLQEET